MRERAKTAPTSVWVSYCMGCGEPNIAEAKKPQTTAVCPRCPTFDLSTRSYIGRVSHERYVLARPAAEVKRTLKELVMIAEKVIAALDIEMKLPASHDRGKRIARILNALEFSKDAARHFGLGKKLGRHL